VPTQIEEILAMTVFISYAHESDDFRAEVRKLVEYLRSEGIQVIADFDHEIVPPKKGWPAWMQHGIEDAQIVLAVCSPKYKARFEKRALPSEGHGVTWEGAILTAGLYDVGLQNNRIFPILPDGMSHDAVPTALKAWDNGHRFPSKQGNISQLVKTIVLSNSGAQRIAMTTENTFEPLTDQGEIVIAKKLALIVKKHRSLFNSLGASNGEYQVAARLVSETETIDDVEQFVFEQIAEYRKTIKAPSESLDFDLRSIVGHLIGLVWHRTLASNSPLSKSEASLVRVPNHDSADYADLFCDLISALSDARPALFNIVGDQRTSLAIRLNNAIKSESGALDQMSHIAHAVSDLKALTSRLLSSPSDVKNRDVQLRRGATAEWDKAKAGVVQVIIQLEFLKKRYGVGAFCYESSMPKDRDGGSHQPAASQISQEDLAKGLAQIGLTSEHIRVLQSSSFNDPKLETLVAQTAGLLNHVNGVFSVK
jgi:TIR domain